MPTDPRHPGRRIGGSDIGKLVGVSRYGNAADVYLRIVEGLEDEWNPRMERGAAVEPELRAHAQKFLGVELEDSESDIHRAEMLEFAHAQVDDIGHWSGLPVAIDYKSQSQWAKGWGAEGSSDVPESIRTQIAWEMLCTDRPLGLLIVGFGSDAPAPVLFSMSHVITYQVQRDGVFESYLVQEAREFWEGHILPRVPPDMKPLGKKLSKSTREKTP